MPTEQDEARALKLQELKESLQRDIESAVAAYEPPGKEPVRVHMDFREDRPDDTEGEPESSIRALVSAFHQQPEVSQSNVSVTHLTAVDSDHDGTVAVKVHFDHAGY